MLRNLSLYSLLSITIGNGMLQLTQHYLNLLKCSSNLDEDQLLARPSTWSARGFYICARLRPRYCFTSTTFPWFLLLPFLLLPRFLLPWFEFGILHLAFRNPTLNCTRQYDAVLIQWWRLLVILHHRRTLVLFEECNPAICHTNEIILRAQFRATYLMQSYLLFIAA